MVALAELARVTRVLERNPEAMNPDPLPGYVWLDTPRKVLHVELHSSSFGTILRRDRAQHIPTTLGGQMIPQEQLSLTKFMPGRPT